MSNSMCEKTEILKCRLKGRQENNFFYHVFSTPYGNLSYVLHLFCPPTGCETPYVSIRDGGEGEFTLLTTGQSGQPWATGPPTRLCLALPALHSSEEASPVLMPSPLCLEHPEIS